MFINAKTIVTASNVLNDRNEIRHLQGKCSPMAEADQSASIWQERNSVVPFGKSEVMTYSLSRAQRSTSLGKSIVKHTD